jgi:hypothetical protein
MSPLYAFIISINSFHGRGFFPTGFLSMLPMAVCAAFEAIISLTIEMSYIAAFTHRYFGKYAVIVPKVCVYEMKVTHSFQVVSQLVQM